VRPRWLSRPLLPPPGAPVGQGWGRRARGWSRVAHRRARPGRVGHAVLPGWASAPRPGTVPMGAGPCGVPGPRGPQRGGGVRARVARTGCQTATPAPPALAEAVPQGGDRVRRQAPAVGIRMKR